MQDENAPIRLLHLSDIHFTAGKSWDADPVLNGLADFIANEAREGLAPDLIAITGDIAQAGKEEEYQLARDWLEKQLWPALPENFPRDRLLLVPGNHDVDRSKVNAVTQAVQKDLLAQAEQEQIAQVLGDAGQRDVLFKRHAAYLAFLQAWYGENHGLPWWQRLIQIGDTHLHIAGLDSAFMAWSETDRGNLLLSRYQVNQTVLSPEAKQAHWRIALLHHPWDYLAEFDTHEARASLHQHCDLLLRGHLHFSQTERVLPPDPTRACLELAAGCVYEHGKYPNAFQWIELHRNPRRIRVLYRVWLHGAWMIDRNQPGCPQGIAEYPLAGPEAPPNRGTVTSRPATPYGERSLHAGAVDGIAKALELTPTLAAALAAAMETDGAKLRELAERLCAPDGDFIFALKKFLAALEAARANKHGLVVPLNFSQRARDILGWMVMTTVLDGFEQEDARLAQRWKDGAVYRIPLGRGPCIEVLMARWREGKAEFGIERPDYDYGKDDVTPRHLGEIGFDESCQPDPARAVDYVLRKIYQEIHREPAQSKLSATKVKTLKQWLENQQKNNKRRLRLVIDRSDLDHGLNLEAYSQAISRELPNFYLIFIDSDTIAEDEVFVLPESQLNAYIYDCLIAIENCP